MDVLARGTTIQIKQCPATDSNQPATSCENESLPTFALLTDHSSNVSSDSPNPNNILRDQPMLLPQLSPAQFVRTWRNFSGNEEQGRQDHFNQICRLIGHETPIERNDLDTFTFEKTAPKPDGRQGKADVWLAGHFVMEYKAKGGDLDDAYIQALGYRDSLGNPPLIITCDFDEIRVHTNFTGKVSVTYIIMLQDLEILGGAAHQRSAIGEIGNSNLSVNEVLSSCFYDPQKLEPTDTPEELTAKSRRTIQRHPRQSPQVEHGDRARNCKVLVPIAVLHVLLPTQLCWRADWSRDSLRTLRTRQAKHSLIE